MAKLSLEELNAVVTDIVTTAKLSNATFSETRNNVVGLLDKIGKIVTVDSVFTNDKLAGFDGEYLPYGKTIEDWYQDLILPQDYDPDGANALAPHDPTYRPVYYSYTLGRKYIPTTIRNNNIERAVNSSSEFISVVSMNTKRLQDSMAQYRYSLKKGIVGRIAELCNTAMSSTTTFSANTAYNEGVYVRSATTGDIVYGIFVKKYTSGDATNWADAVSKGYIIPLELTQTLAKPVDTATGEAFIKQIKADVEKASDVSEGNSLNGNTVGATEGLTLIVKQGVMPTLEVDTEAGAFHLDKLSIPATVKVVSDFGDSAPAGAYAVLIDNRGFRLHNTYNALREDLNGKGDFLNLYQHTEDTGYICRNSFVKVYFDAE